MSKYLSESQEAKCRDLRKSLDGYVGKIAGVASEINDNLSIIRPWEAGTTEKPVTYTANVDVRMYEEIPYTCSQGHTHRGEPGWEPGPESSLWKEAHGTTPATARPYIMRGDNPYMTGEYCLFDNGCHLCKMDNCTWSPSEYPQAWETVEV